MTEKNVTIPQSAIDWLLGDGPDENGSYFGDSIPDRAPRYWWRSHFRNLIASTNTPPPQSHLSAGDPVMWTDSTLHMHSEAITDSLDKIGLRRRLDLLSSICRVLDEFTGEQNDIADVHEFIRHLDKEALFIATYQAIPSEASASIAPHVVGTRIATVKDHNAAFDPADEALGGAFKAGFKEGWIYAEMDADGDRYQEMSEEYGLAVDMAPQECWDAHREKYFAMLPLAAIPEVGATIGDVEGEITRVVQSVNDWDDRTSPDDYPDHLLITSEELTLILRNFAAAITSEVEG